MNIAALLANAARSHGNRPAISLGDTLLLDYAGLYSRITRLAGDPALLAQVRQAVAYMNSQGTIDPSLAQIIGA